MCIKVQNYLQMSDQPHFPSRKIPIGSRSVTGTMPSGDRFESALERDLMYLLEFDSSVDKIVPQPVSIKYLDGDGKLHSYTPDILIYYRENKSAEKNLRIILGEVKYREDLRLNFKEYRPKFKAAIRYAKERGWRFRLFTEREIRTQYLKNAKFLSQYKKFDPNSISDQITLVLEKIRAVRETNVDLLLAAIYQDKMSQAQLLPIVWHLIANQRIGCDLNLPVTMSSRIWMQGVGNE
jgi:hypothetical protein